MAAADLPLAGKTALVTGGSRGLGRETVLGLARAGADVVIASRKLDACEQVAREVREATGRRALPVACHVGRWDDVEQLVETSYAEFGAVDVLVNNAGIAPLYPSLSELSEDLYDKVFAVNLKGPFRLSVLVGERMAAGNGGSIVNISSIAAARPTANDLPYAAAKAGLNSMTLGFAGVLGPNVRVNGIMVGPFLTDISASWDLEGLTAWAKERYAVGRLGDPAEIVGTVLYFASSASSFTTGTVLTVDGGVSISSPYPAG
ncbi:MAG: short-chain dehydrogenase/reductase [Frankiales bacterium]|jgi:NAD(P)-dependent dehydrogenase (short-subunit alcohol dehydrogenase family)|nr:short-chain dehydrogenase/reductase [Frankiales bacterium]MCW2586363.1 short-chain dehydrogenase/reductase [Frankiales bacterium]